MTFAMRPVYPGIPNKKVSIIPCVNVELTNESEEGELIYDNTTEAEIEDAMGIMIAYVG